MRPAVACAGVLLIVVITGSPCVLAQGKPSGSKTASPIMKLFNEECAGCHGEDGHGAINMPGMPNLRDSRFQKLRNDEQLTNAISKGKGLMPTFELVFNPEQLRQLVAYTRSLPSLPVNLQSRTDCKTCHGSIPPGSMINKVIDGSAAASSDPKSIKKK